MTEEEIIRRHAKRIADGWPAPTMKHIVKEARCGHSTAISMLEQIQNSVMMIRMERFLKLINTEPVPEWRTR